MDGQEEKRPRPKKRWLALGMLLTLIVTMAAPNILERWITYDNPVDSAVVLILPLIILLNFLNVPILSGLAQFIFGMVGYIFSRVSYPWRFAVLAVLVASSIPLRSRALLTLPMYMLFFTLGQRFADILQYQQKEKQKRNEEYRVKLRAEKEQAMRDEFAGKNIKTVIFDMYGVIIKESKGNFIPYTLECFPNSEKDRLMKLFHEENLFTRAGNGEITSDEFLTELGFDDTRFHMEDYIENYLTIDEGFYSFAQQRKDKYSFALLSNDVSDWSEYICEYHRLDRYLPVKIVSADVHCRKPDVRIFEIALERLEIPAGECVFIDNNAENLRAARELGMDTILFHRDNEEYDGKTVFSFDELLRIL